MLTLSNISLTYPGQSTPTLHNTSLTLSPNTTLLVGPNAGGKTTLLRFLAGLLEKNSGSISLTTQQTPLTTPNLRRLARMVMQDADPQILGATVREDVDLGRATSHLNEDFNAAAARYAQKLNLLNLWDQHVNTLSYGQKRKLCLLHALLAGPKILLLDEPFAGLDYPAAKELRQFIRNNNKEGLTQVISTHELDPVHDIADKIIVVENGTVAAQGSPQELAPELHRWSVRAPGKGWD